MITNTTPSDLIGPIEHPLELPEMISVPQEGLEWIIVHCSPRCEKKFELFCSQENIPCYLPLRKRVRMYGRRRRVSWLPLFSGYCFAVVPVDQKYVIRQNRYVARVLSESVQTVLVEQLKQLLTAFESGEEVNVYPYIQKGHKVTVLSGAFKGTIAEVVETKEGSQVVINFEMLQQSVVCRIDPSELGPAEDE